MMKSLSNRLHKIALHLPFDPAYWIELHCGAGEVARIKGMSDEELQTIVGT